jgi:hypothetical protein
MADLRQCEVREADGETREWDQRNDRVGFTMQLASLLLRFTDGILLVLSLTGSSHERKELDEVLPEALHVGDLEENVLFHLFRNTDTV